MRRYSGNYFFLLSLSTRMWKRTSFELEWRQQTKDPEMREKYTWKSDSVPSDLFGTQVNNQTNQVPWDNTREWDKIPCQCGANSVLSQWNFQTFWNTNKTQLNCKCTKVPKTSDCVSLQTDSALDKMGKLKNLEQLKVVCPDDKLLTGYKYVHKIPNPLEYATNPPTWKIEYQCCSVK